MCFIFWIDNLTFWNSFSFVVTVVVFKSEPIPLTIVILKILSCDFINSNLASLKLSNTKYIYRTNILKWQMESTSIWKSNPGSLWAVLWHYNLRFNGSRQARRSFNFFPRCGTSPSTTSPISCPAPPVFSSPLHNRFCDLDATHMHRAIILLFI